MRFLILEHFGYDQEIKTLIEIHVLDFYVDIKNKTIFNISA